MKKLLIILLSAFSLTIFAQQKKVAVYVTGEDAGINTVLGSKLVAAIARSAEYSAIERTAAFLSELSKEQTYQRTGAVDDNELSRLGKQFGVRYVCVAVVSKEFNEQYISARLIDVETAQVERTASSNGTIQTLDEIVNAANSVSSDLLATLGQGKQSNTKKVAVYVVKNEAGKNISRVLGDKLVASFTKSGRYIAIERTNSFLSELSKEQTYQRTGAVDDNDISRLGKQFGVQYVCVADVSEVFGEKYVTARLIDVETAEVVNTHDVGGKLNDINSCLKMANEIAEHLSKGSYAEQKNDIIKALDEGYVKFGSLYVTRNLGYVNESYINKEKVASIISNCHIGGWGDWRLPTKSEIMCLRKIFRSMEYIGGRWTSSEYPLEIEYIFSSIRYQESYNCIESCCIWMENYVVDRNPYLPYGCDSSTIVFLVRGNL